MSTDFDELTEGGLDAEDIDTLTEVDDPDIEEEIPVEEDPDAEKDSAEEDDGMEAYINENKGWDE